MSICLVARGLATKMHPPHAAMQPSPPLQVSNSERKFSYGKAPAEAVPRKARSPGDIATRRFELDRRLCDARTISSHPTGWLIEAGVDPSLGSAGDACDNALAESQIGAYKTELIRAEGLARR